MDKKRYQQPYEPSPKGRKNLALLKRKTGWTAKAVIERALETSITNPKFWRLV